eukprot:TRINITY_DN6851_c0_g1_i1.p1 TRINITY_DN6851_c0_g1~~TRINITY_DN6851_c0_g1_i1.p1  ORF type:complete len:366 (+),score=94.49 TRINITY_DN6851_c0_g1_i1:414-1511(+)
MAERKRMSIPPGERQVHTVSWISGETSLGPEDGDSQVCGDFMACNTIPPSRLQWSVVVLDDLTVDLEVSAKLLPDRVAIQEVLLERQARGTRFSGTFVPEKTRRLAAAVADAAPTQGCNLNDVVQSLDFAFSNAFSWFTPKEVELVTLLEFPQPASSAPQPLEASPALQVALPRPQSGHLTQLCVSGVPELRGAKAPVNGHDTSVAAFASSVAGWIEDATPAVPCDSGGIEEQLRVEAASLLEFCLRGPPPEADPFAATEAATALDAVEVEESEETVGSSQVEADERDDWPAEEEDTNGVYAEEDWEDRASGSCEDVDNAAGDDCSSSQQKAETDDDQDRDDSDAEDERRRKRALEKAQRFGRMM